MAKKKDAYSFQDEIVVRYEDGALLVVGEPSRPDELDATDGDTVAVYRIVGVRTFRTHSRLDK